MNLADPELELVDPTPNVHTLFVHFDKVFFWMKLSSRAAVRWSKRMYSCAGVCSYDRGGLCDIALSEPLLKLRPRKDLVETLLHEMIHAFLFVTNRDQDRDGHGPNFKAHMHRINNSAGLNISIYHDFHDEVELYKTHWWRCNGPCQTRKPHFGIVRKSVNRAPNPDDYWWNYHIRNCGGTFVKIKEPEKKTSKASKTISKPMADITKFITTQNNKVPTFNKPSPVIIKKSTNVVIPKQNVPKVISPQQNKSIVVFGGKGQSLNKTENISGCISVADAVKNIWANKFLPGIATSSPIPVKRNASTIKSKNTQVTSPPAKIKKIDDYFKVASSVLKDVYGEDFELSTSDNNNKIIVANTSNTTIKRNLVDCPICNAKVKDTEINRHIDECLNKEVIEELNTPSTAQASDQGGTSDISNNNNSIVSGQKCACCNATIDKPIEQHLDECPAFDKNTTIPTEGSSAITETIVIEDDSEDILNESQILNDTGTKYPCPCCLKIIEEIEMYSHLDVCLG